MSGVGGWSQIFVSGVGGSSQIWCEQCGWVESGICEQCGWVESGICEQCGRVESVGGVYERVEPGAVWVELGMMCVGGLRAVSVCSF